jgi:hypothetical protein
MRRTQKSVIEQNKQISGPSACRVTRTIKQVSACDALIFTVCSFVSICLWHSKFIHDYMLLLFCADKDTPTKNVVSTSERERNFLCVIIISGARTLGAQTHNHLWKAFN